MSGPTLGSLATSTRGGVFMGFKRKFLRLLAVLFAFAMVAAACGGSDSDDDSSSDSGSDTAAASSSDSSDS
ncbi:MAG: hypothetical protein VX971_04160, partial [Actinomycetota bacterium]|nr:hypothetical protein [Actinomycetota bacterium]